jgi:hypothetical protein
MTHFSGAQQRKDFDEVAAHGLMGLKRRGG